MTRKARLVAALDALDRQRDALIARIEAASEAQRSTPPGPGKWSAAQVVLHMALAEEAAVAYLRKKLQFGHHKPSPIMAGSRVLLLNVAFTLPWKYNAPAFIAIIPAVDHATAKARWNAARAALRQAYEALPEERLGQALFKHPFAGRLDVIRGLRTIHIHVRRHAGQVERILHDRH